MRRSRALLFDNVEVGLVRCENRIDSEVGSDDLVRLLRVFAVTSSHFVLKRVFRGAKAGFGKAPIKSSQG